MGGIHIAYRQTDAATYNAVSSDITIPTAGKAIYNDATYGSIVPEFFHVFYKSSYSYTIDAGIAYENNGYWRLFTNLNGTWTNGPLAAATGTKILKSWFSTSGGQYYLNTQFGSVSMQVAVSSGVYNSMLAGCNIYREMVLASNPVGSTQVMPAPAYFKGAKFGNTTLTTSGGAYVAMSTTTSHLHTNVLDSDMPSNWNTVGAFSTVQSGTTFVVDTTSGTFDKVTYPI